MISTFDPNSGSYRERRRRYVNDALAKLKYNPANVKMTEAQLVVHKAKLLTEAVRNHIQPILQAGGGFDKDALGETLSVLYMQGFDKFSKDELVQICTMYHVGIAMEDIDKNPSGGDKPDLLSGE